MALPRRQVKRRTRGYRKLSLQSAKKKAYQPPSMWCSCPYITDRLSASSSKKGGLHTTTAISSSTLTTGCKMLQSSSGYDSLTSTASCSLFSFTSAYAAKQELGLTSMARNFHLNSAHPIRGQIRVAPVPTSSIFSVFPPSSPSCICSQTHRRQLTREGMRGHRFPGGQCHLRLKRCVMIALASRMRRGCRVKGQTTRLLRMSRYGRRAGSSNASLLKST